MNDRERLIDILYEGFYISPENDIKGTAQKAANLLISDGVTVQKHGRWIEGKSLEKCSICGKKGFPDWHYCPNCGAKMDGAV